MTASAGWVGSLLRVNLTTGESRVEPSEPYVKRFIGGRGIGQWILLNEVDPAAGAFDPANKVVLSTGPLVGTSAPMSSRLSIDTKNPQSGGVGSSNVGGHFAAEVKYAGFDAIVLEGRCARPSWLLITDGEARLVDAHPIWGARVATAERALKDEMGDQRLKILSIGPAGENQVMGACVIADGGRAGGRCGTGAVLGSKLLKAVAVRGHGAVQVANPAAFALAVDGCTAKLEGSKIIQSLRKGGTHLTYGTGGLDGRRPTGVRNSQDEYWDPERFKLLAEPLMRQYETRRLACFNCPAYCSHYYRITDGPYAGAECEGIHANAIRAFGPSIDAADLGAIAHAQGLCAELGLDVDAVGACLGWVFECYQRKVMTVADTGGLELVWGNHAEAISLIEQIAYRRGLGALLALGVKRAAEALGRGSSAWAMHVRGADMNEGAVRANKAWAFGIALSQRAGGHLDGATSIPLRRLPAEVCESLYGTPTAADPEAYEGQERLIFWVERLKAAVDTLGVCCYGSAWAEPTLPNEHDFAALLTAATGEEYDAEKLLRHGQRVRNVEKAFNTLHAGFGRTDDTLPARLFEHPIGAGPFAGAILDRSGWSRLLDAYYILQGWDATSGWQTEELLVGLGLESVAEKLRAHGRLPAPAPAQA